jgi:hypothetical protein
MLLQPISVPSTTTMGVDGGQLRPDHAEPVDASARTQSGLRVLVAARAVVVQFGAQAIGLARSPLKPNPKDALPAADDDIEALHGSALGSNETNAALLGALDSNARRARLLTPGTTEPELGLLYQAPKTSQSGFFRSSGATGAESLLASDGLDDGLDWLFPGSPSSQALDSAFARPDAEFAVESTFPELPASTTPSLATAASQPRASGFFSSADAPPAGSATTAPGTTFDASELSAEQRRETQTLERSAGYGSSVQLRYEVGPDGRHYLVEPGVPFDVTPVPGDPAATLRKMEAIRRATSSGSPSTSARNAAAEAAQLALRARAQLAAERYAEAQEF